MIDTQAIRAKVLELLIQRNQWPIATLESIVKTIPSKQYQILESEVKKVGSYRVISQSKEFSIGYSEEQSKVFHHERPVIVFGDHTTVVKLIDFDFIVGADGVKILEPDYSLITPQYLYLTMLYNLLSFIEAGGYARHYRYVKKFEIPIPPLSEQYEIVSKVNAIFSLLDTIDTLQSQYQDNLAALKSKLIDTAIQGKLTEQLPEDGTAEELYQQIQQEKAALEKAGKIKKSKPLPPISEEEKPFHVPDNWKWVRLGDFYTFTNGTASRGTPGGSPHPVLRLADLTSGKIKIDNIRNIELSDGEFDSHKLMCNDLVFVRVNGSRDRVGTAYRYSADADISYCDHLFCGHPVTERIVPDYIVNIFGTATIRAQLEPEIKTTAGQNTISQVPLRNILIPLPPLAEQKRIVAKLEELLPLCES